MSPPFRSQRITASQSGSKPSHVASHTAIIAHIFRATQHDQLLGIALIALAAFALSAKRGLIDKRTVLGAFFLQAGLGGIVLYVPLGKDLLDFLAQKVIALLNYSRAGIDFLFGGVVGDNIGFVFAFNVLPVIIFFSSMIAVLYYLGVMQWVVAVIGGALKKLIRTSHSESMAAAANIFVGQTKHPSSFALHRRDDPIRTIRSHGWRPVLHRWISHGRLRRARHRGEILTGCQRHGRARGAHDGQDCDA